MAIDPTTTTTVRVSELASAGYNTTDLIPHEVAGILKKGNLQDLATFIGGIISTEGAVGFRAVTVTDGQTLPATTEEEFILVGPGTFPNVGGGLAITTTEPLNALVSNGTYWFIGVEIPIAASGAWGSIAGEIENQTDLQDALNLKANLVDGKVPASELPSYVDDVVEVANYAALPNPGETGKIYITLDTNKVYRWSGSVYIEVAANSSVWGMITGTLSNQTDLQSALNGKEPTITAGTTSQYYRGDKTFQTLNSSTVGLGNVNNTSDANKPVSTATQTALNLKANLASPTFTGTVGGITKSMVGLGNVDNTTDLNKPISTATQTALDLKQAALSGTGFVKISGTTISYDNTTYLSGTVAIANGGTGATTASAARTNLGATTIGNGIFTLPNAGLVSFLRINADNTVELLGADLFRTSIGAGTGSGSVTSVNGTGSYGGLTLTGTVTGAGDLTLGGTPTGTWPISITGNASSVNTVQVSTNADFYLTFADANNGSPTSEFLYTIGSVKVNPSTGALTAGSFVKSGGTSSQFLMADGSVSTGLGGTVTGTGTAGQVAFWNGTSSISGESNLFWDSTNDRLGIGTTTSLSYRLQLGTAVGTAASVLSALNPILYLDSGSSLNNSIVIKTHSAGNGNSNGSIKFASSPDGINYSWSGIAGITNASNSASNLAFYTASSNSQGTAAGASTEQMRIFTTGNITIQNGGTFTDAGFRLDVNGLQAFRGTSASDTAPLGAELAAVTGTGANWTLAGTNLNVGGYTHTTGSVVDLTTTLAAVSGTYYQIAYTITGRTTGSITINYGGTSTSGITATGALGPLAISTAALTITPTTDFNGTIVLSIKSIGGSSATTTFLSSTGTATNSIRVSDTISNTFIGINAGRRNTTATSSTFIGNNAGQNNTTGGGNTFIGASAGGSNNIGSANTFVGNNAGNVNTTGVQNTFIGSASGNTNTSGDNNTFIGRSSGANNSIGGSNTFIGIVAGNSNTTGNNNIALGQAALQFNNTGLSNVAIGNNTLINLTGGGSNNNIALGLNAGRYAGSGTTAMTSVNNSMYLGFQTRGLNATGSTNEIVIGYDVVGLGSNTTVLGNSSTTTTAIYGNLLLGQTTDNGTDKLQITGTARVSSSVTAGSFIRNGGTSAQYLMADGSISTLTNPVTGLGTTNYIPKFTGASVIGNSLIYDNGTNVGIGTPSPAAKLDVNGHINVTSAAINFGGSGSALSTDPAIYRIGGANDLAFAIGSTERMRIFSSGNVFIGSSPTDNGAKLLIKGANSTPPTSGTTTTAVLRLSGGTGIYNVLDFGINETNDYSWIQSTRANSLSTYDYLAIQPNGGNLLIGTTTNAGYKLDVNGTGRINGGVNLATSSGNVGIGAGPASQKLDVNGNIRINNGSPTANTLIGILGFGPSGYGGINTSEISANFEGVNWYNGSNLIFKTSQSGDITASSSVERMRITSGGNVGIGTILPSSRFHVDHATIDWCSKFTNNSKSLVVLSHGDGYGMAIDSVTNTDSIYLFKLAGGNGSSLGSVERFKVGGTGNVTASGTVTASGGFFNSDMRLKDLTHYDYNVSDIKPITYLWKDGRDNKKHVGYSAQEVQKVMPDAVNEDEKGFLSVNYIEVLVAKIAELENRIKQLEK